MTSKEAKAFGKNVKARRKELGWNQEKLAEKVNVSKNTISNIERAETEVSSSTLIGLADALNVSIDSLLDRSVDLFAGAGGLSEQEMRIISLLRMMGSEQQAGAEQMLNIYFNNAPC